MRFKFISLALLMTLMSVLCAWSQTVDDTGAPVQAGPQPVFTYPDTTHSLDFLSGAVENSALTLGGDVGMTYLSNGYGSGQENNSSRIGYTIAPLIKIQQYFPKLSWSGSYSGGLQEYRYLGNSPRNTGNNNIFRQNATGQVLWQFAPHWQLHGKEQFTHSANPFDSYIAVPGDPSSNDPNNYTYYALSQFTHNDASLGLTDQITKRDSLDFLGTENYRHTDRADLTSVPFYNLTSYGGRASYNHVISPRVTVGGSYDYNSLDFGHGFQRSGTQSIIGSVQYLLRKGFIVSVWIGPEYVAVKSLVPYDFFGQIFYLTVHQSQWTYSTGASVGWKGIHQSARGSFSRIVSDGGGILATTQTYVVQGDFRQQLSRRWDVNIGSRYWNNTSITVSNRSFWNLGGNVSFTRQFAKSLTGTVQYAYVTETKHNISVGLPKYHNNIVAARLTYQWHHPLGR